MGKYHERLSTALYQPRGYRSRRRFTRLEYSSDTSVPSALLPVAGPLVLPGTAAMTATTSGRATSRTFATGPLTSSPTFSRQVVGPGGNSRISGVRRNPERAGHLAYRVRASNRDRRLYDKRSKVIENSMQATRLLRWSGTAFAMID